MPLTNNTTGFNVVSDYSQIPKQLPTNYIDPYNYAMVYQPELIPELVYSFGKGSILGFMRATQSGMNKTYSSDKIQHAEAGRLHRFHKSATIAGNDITFPTAHGLEKNMVIRFKNASNVYYQAIVSRVTSSTVATILNDGMGALPTGAVSDISVDFSSRFLKGDEAFKQGVTHGVRIYENYSHTFKHHQETTNSDMGHNIWVKTKEGVQWFNYEMARESAKFDNITELTAIFHRRAKTGSASQLAGFAQGMHGVVEIIEGFGNVFNDLITTVNDLSAIAFRAKQNNCRELNMWCSHRQMAKFRELAGGVNASFLQGFNYGSFNNSMEMALNLDFSSIKVDGVQFNFVAWEALNDPTLSSIFGGTEGLNFIGIPTGNTSITVDGGICSVGKIEMLFRKTSHGIREKETKFFGKLGTPVPEDKSWVDWLSEGTVRVSAPNQFFIGGKY